MGRTAVVAGTATAVSGNVARRQQAKAAAQAPPPMPEQAAAVPPQAAAPAAEMDSKVDALTKLGALKEQGILTDEEFAAEKAKILAG